MTTMQQKCEYMLRCMISYCRKLLRKEVRVNLYGGGGKSYENMPSSERQRSPLPEGKRVKGGREGCGVRRSIPFPSDPFHRSDLHKRY